MDEILNEVANEMEKVLGSFKHEINKIRTGRASLLILDGVKVDYYGTMTPLNQVANLTIPEPKMIIISPWDKSLLTPIEKAILKADLGLNPLNDGKIIRIPIPDLTDERKSELVRVLKRTAEDYRIGLRKVRRDYVDKVKKMEKKKELSEDESKRVQEKIQEKLDSFMEKLEEIVKNREKDILST